MSVENAKKFKKDLEENEEVKANVKKELEALKDSGKKESELLPEVARKLGYDFTDEEFEEVSKILSDYYANGICESCKSKNVTKIEGSDCSYLICHNCNHETHID